MLIWILLALVVAMLVYIRIAPSDPVRWHRQAPHSDVTGEKRLKGGYIWRAPVEGDGMDQLRALDQAATASDRTTRLTGSVEDGQITYISRTARVGFPDYTTIGVYTDDKGQRYIEAFGRLRFGRSDMGVNAKRIKGWLAAAQL